MNPLDIDTTLIIKEEVCDSNDTDVVLLEYDEDHANIHVKEEAQDEIPAADIATCTPTNREEYLNETIIEDDRYGQNISVKLENPISFLNSIRSEISFFLIEDDVYQKDSLTECQSQNAIPNQHSSKNIANAGTNKRKRKKTEQKPKSTQWPCHEANKSARERSKTRRASMALRRSEMKERQLCDKWRLKKQLQDKQLRKKQLREKRREERSHDHSQVHIPDAEQTPTYHTYTCDLCKETFTKKTDLRRHVYNHMGVASFPCSLCDKRYLQYKSLYRHKKRSHVKAKPYDCIVCGMTFRFLRKLRSHKRTHIERQAEKAKAAWQPFLCEICGKIFRSAQHALVHSASLGDKKPPRPHVCQLCDKCYATRSSLTTHYNDMHGNNDEFVCDICGKSCRRKASIIAHLRGHSNMGRFPCPVCHKTFSERHLLKDHLLAHSGARSFKCEQCELAFNCKKHLTSHRMIHTGLRPYQCDECEKNYIRRRDLKRHTIAIHLGIKPYPCVLCNKEYASKEFLDKHTKSIHSGLMPFICDACDLKFTTKAELRKHTKAH